MRNVSKTTTLESKFPLLAVENNCILSKDADITACFEVRLPELFTVASAEYEAIHSAWHKAIKTLPDFTVVHKQDWYIKESYAPDLAVEDLDISRSRDTGRDIALRVGYWIPARFLNTPKKLPRRK